MKRSLDSLGALLLVPVIAFFLMYGADRAILARRILRGVWIGSVAAGGLDRTEAVEAVSALAKRLEREPLLVKVDSAIITVDPRELSFHVDVEETVDQAWSLGRRGGMWVELQWWAQRLGRPAPIDPVARLDRAKLVQELSQWERRGITDVPFGGGVTVQGGEPKPQYPKPGWEVDREAAERAILGGLAQERHNVVELPLRRVTPALDRPAVDAAVRHASRMLAGPVRLLSSVSPDQLSLTREELATLLVSRELRRGRPSLELDFDPQRLRAYLDPLRAKIEHPPRDASFVVHGKDKVRIVPAEDGVRLNESLVARALEQAAHAPGRLGLLPLDRSEQPRLSTEHAHGLGIKQLVSQFTTFHPCCRPRVENIHRIADLLDGKVVLPGEAFSVNAAVGPRTKANGFIPAPTIEEGDMVDSLGGGISQFATTLFNAVFHGGYDIIERQPHSYYFSRYPVGHEATLSYPKPDLIFRNDTAAGLLLKCEYGKTFIRVLLYGDNGGRRTQAKVSARYDIVKPKVELMPNPSLLPDEEEVEEAGALGWTVSVGRVVMFPDGTKKEEKREVTYKPRVRRVQVHPCRIPPGEPGHTGEACPIPEDEGTPPEPIPIEIAPDSPLDEGF